MSSIVEISAATLSVECDASGAAQHVVNVHNISGKKLRVGGRIIADEPTNAEWLGPITAQGKENQHEWDLDADQTIQLTIPIAAENASPGKYTFRVEVYSTESPSEDFTTGDGIAFEVVEQKSEPKPTPKPFPWAIVIVAVIVGLLILGGGGWAIYNATSYTHVPDLVNESLDDAKLMIEEEGLVVGDVTSRHEGDKPKDTVIDQKPDPEEKVKKGSLVQLVTESGTSTPVTPVTPGIHKQGRFTVRQTWHGDLDTGAESNNGADFWFQAATATERFLVPKNGAKFVRMGSRVPKYADCKGASFSTNKIAIQTLSAGTSVCAMTSEGRVSAFRVLSNVGPSPGKLNISFTTWKKRLIRIPRFPVQPIRPLIGN